jgi:hypothetical protein
MQVSRPKHHPTLTVSLVRQFKRLAIVFASAQPICAFTSLFSHPAMDANPCLCKRRVTTFESSALPDAATFRRCSTRSSMRDN